MKNTVVFWSTHPGDYWLDFIQLSKAFLSSVHNVFVQKVIDCIVFDNSADYIDRYGYSHRSDQSCPAL